MIDISALSLASVFVTTVCILAVMMVRQELQGTPEKPYLLGFLATALAFFIMHTNSSFIDTYYFRVTDNITGAASAVLLPMAICQKSQSDKEFRLLTALFTVQIAVIFLDMLPGHFSYSFALVYLGILCKVLLTRQAKPSGADYGLMATVILFFLVMMVELVLSNVTEITEESMKWIFENLLVVFPAYMASTTMFIILGYVLDANHSLNHLANYDPLTELPNRRYAFESMGKHLESIQRQAGQASIVIADIDKFKRVNDTYGHIFGDKVIAEFSAIIQKCIRKNDVPCRYGGEEFLIFMPNTDKIQAAEVAERIRKQLMQTEILLNSTKAFVTSSFGVAVFNLNEDLSHNIEVADAALYQAKNNGRNRVEIA